MLHTSKTFAERVREDNEIHYSLTEYQISYFKNALGSRWEIFRHVNLDGNVAIMLSPLLESNSELDIYVDAEPSGMSLSILREDTLIHIGNYSSMTSIISSIKNYYDTICEL